MLFWGGGGNVYNVMLNVNAATQRANIFYFVSYIMYFLKIIVYKIPPGGRGFYSQLKAYI